MQFGPYRHRGPPPHGVEGWLPPLVVALTSVILVIALIYFIFVANNMRGRIPLPRTTIPMAMVAAALVGLYMVLRAVGQFREAWRIWRGTDSDES